MEANEVTNNSLSIPKYLILIFIICFAFLIAIQSIPRMLLHSQTTTTTTYKNNTVNSYNISLNKSVLVNNLTSSARTLVLYIYGKTHDLAEDNLEFFIRNAIRNIDDADYYIILQQINNKTFNEQNLPHLPSNAHYFQHENKCYDIGTIGWFLSKNITDKTKYKYFIFLNSSIRGPYIVSYYDNTIWYTIFTRRLNDRIKLVGCTINCEVFPHVQSYFWALDLEGLNLLLKDGTVLACHENQGETIFKGEIGDSRVIINAGFGISCLMKKYQDMDFRLEINQKCNYKRNPTFTNVDGISLDPFEIVFVKIKHEFSQYQHNRERASAYEKWIYNCPKNCSRLGSMNKQ